MPAAKLAFLAPRFWLEDGGPDYIWYRTALAFVIALSTVFWYPVIRVARHSGEALNRGIAIGGAAVLLLSLLLLDFPYRLAASADARKFQEVKWRGASCFIIGERQIDLLLFCPAEPPPRNKVVRKSDPGLEETHSFTDIFTNVEKPQ